MRESRSSGSVGGEGGNALAYPAGDKLPSMLMEHHGRNLTLMAKLRSCECHNAELSVATRVRFVLSICRTQF
jgi:hypothetical protein